MTIKSGRTAQGAIFSPNHPSLPLPLSPSIPPPLPPSLPPDLGYGVVVSPDVLQKPQVRKQRRGEHRAVIHILQPIQRVCPRGLQPIAILAGEEDGRGGGEEGEDTGGGTLNQVGIGEGGLEGRGAEGWGSRHEGGSSVRWVWVSCA